MDDLTDNRDPLTWLFLGRAWSLLLRYPSQEVHEQNQRISNSSLAFRKAIHISTTISQNSKQSNRFRLAYVEHLEELSKFNEAISVLQDGLNEDENDIECWWELGRMMEKWSTSSSSNNNLDERIQKLEHACLAYQKAISLQPDDINIQSCLIDAKHTLDSLKKSDQKLSSSSSIPENTSSISDLKKSISNLPEIPEFNQNKNNNQSVELVNITNEQQHPPPPIDDHQICFETLIESVNSPSTSSSSSGTSPKNPQNSHVSLSLSLNYSFFFFWM